mgnify:CR=1 FL=1
MKKPLHNFILVEHVYDPSQLPEIIKDLRQYSERFVICSDPMDARDLSLQVYAVVSYSPLSPNISYHRGFHKNIIYRDISDADPLRPSQCSLNDRP